MESSATLLLDWSSFRPHSGESRCGFRDSRCELNFEFASRRLSYSTIWKWEFAYEVFHVWLKDFVKSHHELAEDMFKEHTRKLVEGNISVALNILKSRTRAVYNCTT